MIKNLNKNSKIWVQRSVSWRDEMLFSIAKDAVPSFQYSIIVTNKYLLLNSYITKPTYMLIKVSTQAAWDQGNNITAYFSTMTPWSKVLYLHKTSLLCWRRSRLAFVVAIIFFYLLLVTFSFVLDFESRKVEADLTAFALGICAARILNDVTGSFPSRVPLSPVASSRSHLCLWLLWGGKYVGKRV